MSRLPSTLMSSIPVLVSVFLFGSIFSIEGLPTVYMAVLSILAVIISAVSSFVLLFRRRSLSGMSVIGALFFQVAGIVALAIISGKDFIASFKSFSFKSDMFFVELLNVPGLLQASVLAVVAAVVFLLIFDIGYVSSVLFFDSLVTVVVLGWAVISGAVVGVGVLYGVLAAVLLGVLFWWSSRAGGTETIGSGSGRLLDLVEDMAWWT